MTIFRFSQLGYVGVIIAMNYPDKEPKELPFTEMSQNGLNQKNRKVFCQYCKYSIVTNLFGAQCGQCKSFLIEYVKSNFNDERLVNRDNGAT